MRISRCWMAGAFVLAASFPAPAQAAVPENPLESWQVVASPSIGLRGLAYQNGRFVGVGHSTNIVVSANGTDWSMVTNGLDPQWESLLAVATGGGQFVAVGNAILSSSDGLQWIRRETVMGNQLWAVTYAAGQFVAVGSGFAGAIAATSPDGITWEVFNLPINTSPRNIAYGNGKYIAVGPPVSIVSTNGRDWAPINSLLAQGIAFDGAQFIATLATNGFSSADGTNWASFPLPNFAGPTGQDYYTARFANGIVITGGRVSHYGLLVTSASGGAYTPAANAVTQSMGASRDAVFVDGHFYLADQSGRIWRSGRIAPLVPPVFTGVSQSFGQVTLSFSVPVGYHYTVESAERLDAPEWQPLGVPVFPTVGEVGVTDSILENQTRFYRLRLR
jgi:hypothetical protein